MQTLSPIGRHEIGGVSSTSVIAVAGITFLLGAVTPVAIRTAMNLVQGTNYVTSYLPSAPSPIEQKGGKSVHSVLLPKPSSVGDGVMSALKSFADEVNFLIETSTTTNSIDEDWGEVATDFVQKTNAFVSMVLRDVGQEVGGLKLDICTHEGDRQPNDVDEATNAFVRREGEPSGHDINANKIRDTGSTNSDNVYTDARVVPNANISQTPSSGGRLVRPAPSKLDDAGDDEIASDLKRFANVVNSRAEVLEKMNSNSTSHSVKHGRQQIAIDLIESLLRELALDVEGINLNIRNHQRGRKQPHEDDANDKEKVMVKSVGQQAGKSSTRLGSHVNDKSETSDPNLVLNRSTTPRVLGESSYDEDEDEDGHKINARFSRLPLETCVKCCPKDGKGGHRRTTNRVEEDVRLAEGADDKHRATWITPSWVESCVICCDDDRDEPTCPPVPAPEPCPTPPPTTSCPEPVPCPTPPPTTIPPPPVPCPTPPPSPSPAPDTCIEPLEDLDDFTPCDIELTRTYYRVRTFTIQEGCEVSTNGPLVVESVNATIHGNLTGKGEGGAGASGCNLISLDDADCSLIEDGQGSGGGTSGSVDADDGVGGGGGGYGGEGGDSGDSGGGFTYEDLLPGSGGGAGRGQESATSGSGGNGGGLISFLSTDTFVLGANGTISVDGDDGGDGAGSSFAGGGGGGSGGGVEVTACNAIVQGRITASGGDGGDGFNGVRGGGGGGGGRIRITTETPSDVMMGSLIVNGGAGGDGGDQATLVTSQ